MSLWVKYLFSMFVFDWEELPLRYYIFYGPHVYVCILCWLVCLPLKNTKPNKVSWQILCLCSAIHTKNLNIPTDLNVYSTTPIHSSWCVHFMVKLKCPSLSAIHVHLYLHNYLCHEVRQAMTEINFFMWQETHLRIVYVCGFEPMIIIHRIKRI